MNMRIVLLLASVSVLASCVALGTERSGAQYGAAAARPYTPADLAHGHALKLKMDAARATMPTPESQKAAMEPFRIVGDTYFAGVRSHAVYVIKTPEGVIMIDNGWADTAPQVEASLKTLGVNLTDIRIMLMTEGHGDHAGATAYFKDKSGAKLYVMEGDVDIVEKRATGAAKVDRILHDRETVTFGGKVLTAYHIPGHSAGSTTWYWQERERGQTYNVASVCCWSTPANVVTNADFPTTGLRRNFQTLKALPVDIPTLGPTVDQFDMLGKLERIKAGEDRLNVFVDPQGYRGVAALYEEAFEEKLQKQLKEGPPPVTPAAPAPAAPAPAR
jgi:metallo-beta-lactamase class B